MSKAMQCAAYIAVSLLSVNAPANARIANNDEPHVIFDENCVVTRFYGVPLKLKLSELSGLKIDHTRGYVSGEGDYYPAATLLVGKNVLLQAEFDSESEHELYRLSTTSPGAIGPRGVTVGTTLLDVKKRWPEGKLSWGIAEGPYVVFTTGTNVYFDFSPADMPPRAFDNPPVPEQTATGEWATPPMAKVVPDPDLLRVTKIRISSRDFDYTCPRQARKSK